MYNYIFKHSQLLQNMKQMHNLNDKEWVFLSF